MEIQHFSHRHPLTLKLMTPRETNSITCSACRKSFVDMIYSCKVCQGYHLHKSCAELPEKITEHPFHPQHPLPLVFNNGNFACCGCGKWDSILVYSCKACNFTLSPDCALKPTTKYEFLGQGQIRHFLHKHPLSLMDTKLADMAVEVCSACEKRCSGKVTYYCRQCPDFKLHRSCAEQLPRAIRHPFDLLHPMILRAKDYYFDRPCQTCKRTDHVVTYRCSMCRVEMDPDCALSTSAKTLI